MVSKKILKIVATVTAVISISIELSCKKNVSLRWTLHNKPSGIMEICLSMQVILFMEIFW